MLYRNVVQLLHPHGIVHIADLLEVAASTNDPSAAVAPPSSST